MTDNIVCKTVPLPLDDLPDSETAEEREARVQAHMNRVHPMLDAIRREEARVYLEIGDRVERNLCNARKWKRRKRASQRAARRGM